MAEQYKRIENGCKAIWGDVEFDIDIDIETDWDHPDTFQGVIRRDYGDKFGPPLMMTNICYSGKQAWRELELLVQPRKRESKALKEAEGKGELTGQLEEWKKLMGDKFKLTDIDKRTVTFTRTGAA